MFGEVVYMVGDNHQVADRKIRICAATGIGNEQGLDTQFAHYTYREGYFLHGIALVKMETSLHRHDVFMAQFAEDKFSAVSLYGRDGEVGDFFVPYLILFSDFTGKTAESGTEDDCCLRLGVHLSLQKGCCFLNAL